MAIAFTHPIQGPDPDATGRGWQSLADQLLAAREQQRLREQARAAALFQEKQLAAQQQKWQQETETARDENSMKYAAARESAEREKARDKLAADTAAEARTRAQAAEREKMILAARAASDAGDRDEAARLYRAAGGAPEAQEMPTERVRLDRRITMDPIAIERGGRTGPVTGVSVSGGAEQDIPTGERPSGTRYRMPDGGVVTDDPDARRAAAEQQRLDKAARALAPYADMATGDPDIKTALDLTKKRIMAGGGDADKALDDFGAMVSKIQGDRSAEKRSRISANAARARAGEKAPAGTITEVANIDATMRAVGELKDLIKAKPEAWGRYRKNAEAWQRKEIGSSGGIVDQIIGAPRRIAQVAGLADIAPEQGLKNDPDALKIHQGMEKMLTGAAKAFGGVITASDIQRAQSQIATLGMDPDQALEYVQTTFDDLARKRGFFDKNARGDFSKPAGPSPHIEARDHSKSRADRLKNGGKSLSELSDEEFTNL